MYLYKDIILNAYVGTVRRNDHLKTRSRDHNILSNIKNHTRTAHTYIIFIENKTRLHANLKL